MSHLTPGPDHRAGARGYNVLAYRPREVTKAVCGALLAGLTAAGTAVTDGSITAAEWIGIATAVVATFGGVFAVNNTEGVAQ